MNSAKQIKKLLPKDKPKPVEKPAIPEPPKKTIPPSKPVPIKPENVIPKVEQRDVRKEAEFSAFILWNTIPIVIKQQYKKNPEDLESLGYDIDDPIFVKLLSINTKGQFAKAFGISPDTISDWLKRPDYHQRLDKMLRGTVLKWRKDVDAAFMRKLMKHGDPARYKLYHQIFLEFAERTEITGKDGDAIKLEDAREELAGRINSIVTNLGKNGNTKKNE